MKIIFGDSRDAIAEHARELVAKKDSEEPRGIAHHSARTPQVCDDCGETFWHRYDPYMWFPHHNCTGGKKRGTGF